VVESELLFDTDNADNDDDDGDDVHIIDDNDDYK